MNRRWRGGGGCGTTEGADLIDATERAHRVNHKLLDLISVVSFFSVFQWFHFSQRFNGSGFEEWKDSRVNKETREKCERRFIVSLDEKEQTMGEMQKDYVKEEYPRSAITSKIIATAKRLGFNAVLWSLMFKGIYPIKE